MATSSDLVLVEDGTEKRRYKFSRVPAVGEKIKLKDALYRVTAVTHTPGGTYHLAEIKITPVR
jgi:hypothetical protein